LNLHRRLHWLNKRCKPLASFLLPSSAAPLMGWHTSTILPAALLVKTHIDEYGIILAR